jgi:transcriptional regulator
MYGQYRKIDPAKVLKLKSQGLSGVEIARRLDVSVAAVSLVLREAKTGGHKREGDKP